MLFNSFVFLIFSAIFFLGWPLFRRGNNLRWGWIIAASFVFYGWWDWRFLILIVISGLIDYFAALLIYHFPRLRKPGLIASLCGNLGILFAFKYSGFAAANLEALLRLCGWDVSLVDRIPGFALILPVGISFYTFQSMSYTIDVYRGELTPTKNPLHFFAFLTMFPQLVAGPIVRGRDILPQLADAKPSTEEERWEGTRLIVHGYFKKVVIADNLAGFVNRAFAEAHPGGSAAFWWFVVTCFAAQIYCDFSGYSDIARGLARWMGYDFKRNFNHPYISKSLREFWTRWHISLSTWFKDYVYIPLGGSRGSTFRSHANLWITMLASGLWHGAAWTFIVWAAIHAAAMSLERIFKLPERLGKTAVGRLAGTALTLLIVWAAWVFFRAKSLPQGLEIVATMFRFQEICDIFALPKTYLAVAAILALREAWFYLGMDECRIFRGAWRRTFDVCVLGIMLACCILFRGSGAVFIYFQF